MSSAHPLRSRITGHVFMATSLDGMVSRLNDQVDWLAESSDTTMYEAFIDSVDGLVMGSGSFKNVLSFDCPWPYPKPVYVMSRTMTDTDVPDDLKDKVFVTSKSPVDLMQFLADEKRWKRVYVDGGRVVQSFIKDGLVEDACLTMVPILIGPGKRLFEGIEGDIPLETVSVKHDEKTGMVSITYGFPKAS